MATTKTISLSIIIAGLIIAGAIFFSGAPASKKESAPVQNVSIKDGKQTIEIIAKGGFSPRMSVAKAGVPTVLKITTQGTFDCSSVVSIPELQITKNLPNTGVTEIDLGARNPGILDGTCGMGMYPFEIDFQ
ncbi:MAG: cupredoxin domain-containing protein [Candidatus Parcubacteria bacterium]|nr:cupredoxin domain-containing protein [Candidatus Parcubacteria bacterium]